MVNLIDFHREPSDGSGHDGACRSSPDVEVGDAGDWVVDVVGGGGFTKAGMPDAHPGSRGSGVEGGMRKRGLQAVLLSSLFMIVFAGGAQAHRVAPDEDNPALDYLRDENRQDLALGVAEYCAGQSIPVSICVQRLGKDLRAAEAATECADEISWHTPLDPTTAHGISVDPENKSQKVFHTYYAYHKEMGLHRHDWGEASRETAAYQKAAELVEFLKKSFSGKTTTTEAGAKGHIDVSSEGGVDTGVAKAKTGVTAGGSGEYSQKETEVGPSKEEIQKAWDRGYALGKSQPWSTSVVPDIMCTKDKKGVASCNGGPDPTLAVATKPDSQPTPQSCDCQCPPDFSDQVSMNPTFDPKKSTVEGSNDKVASPLESCFQERLEKKRKDLYSDYAEATEEQKTLRRRAEEALKGGVCMPEWFGQDFCRDFDIQKAIKVTEADAAPPIPETTKAEKMALTVELAQPSQEEIERRQEAERLARCKDPALTEAEKRLYDCATAVDPWCNDPRATFEEKQQLGCPGFESGLLDVPSAEECLRMSALEKVEHGCPDDESTAGSTPWGGNWMLDSDPSAESSDACPSSNEATTYGYDSW